MGLLYTIYYHGNAMDTDVPLPDAPSDGMDWAQCVNGDGHAYQAIGGGWFPLTPYKFEPGIVGVSREELEAQMLADRGLKAPGGRPEPAKTLSVSAAEWMAQNSPEAMRKRNRGH